MKNETVKVFEENGFTATVTDETVKWEISIENLIRAFDLSPENYSEDGENYLAVNESMKMEFAKYVARQLMEPYDSETGMSCIEQAIDNVFMNVFEDTKEFACYPESR